MSWKDELSVPVAIENLASLTRFEGGYTREDYASLFLLGHLTTYLTTGGMTPEGIRAHLIELANTMAREWCASREPKEQGK
jgi:hypothetical protein